MLLLHQRTEEISFFTLELWVPRGFHLVLVFKIWHILVIFCRHQTSIITGTFILQNNAVVISLLLHCIIFINFFIFQWLKTYRKFCSYTINYRTNTKEELLMALPWLQCLYAKLSVLLEEEHCECLFMKMNFQLWYTSSFPLKFC